MAVAFSTLVSQTRRYLRDWSDFDSLNGSVSSTTTTITVADSTLYAKRWPIEVDLETMMIRAIPTATTLTVERGAFGSTPTTHADTTSILIRPDFFAVEIMDAVNEGLLASFPLLYKQVRDESITTTDSTYEYTIPNMPGTYSGVSWPIPRLFRVSVKQAGDLTYRKLERWEIVRGSTPKIKFRSAEPASGTLRLEGFGPFPPLVLAADTLDAQYPPDANYLLPLYAAANLLLSGEARRVRVDTGAIDAREQATRVGASSAIGSVLYNRWRAELITCAMPPLPKHTKRVI